MTDGFFFAQQTLGAEREKSGRHKPLQRLRAQPDGRPERAAAPQVAWRKTRNNAGDRNVRKLQFFKHSGRMKAERPTSVIIQLSAIEDCDVVHRRSARTPAR